MSLTTARQLEPYTMTPKKAAEYFGYHEKTIYAMVEGRELGIGTHYLADAAKINPKNGTIPTP